MCFDLATGTAPVMAMHSNDSNASNKRSNIEGIERPAFTLLTFNC